MTEDGVKLARGIISTVWTALDVLPAASETLHVINVNPDLNGPVALGDGESSPSFKSTAVAVPISTSVILPVAPMLISAGIVSSGGNSSLVGSVPASYSSRLVNPSPSKSPLASEGSFGSNPYRFS